MTTIRTQPSDDDEVMPELWERQPNESEEAWEAFVLYRELGDDRSLAKVCSVLGKSDTMLDRWSSRHRWTDRVQAWDRQLDRAVSAAAASAVAKATAGMAERHGTQAQLTLEAVLAPIRVAVKRLREDPRFVGDLTLMAPGDLMDLVAKMAKYVPTLIMAERIARGQPTSIVQAEISIEVRPTAEQLARVLDALVEAKALPAPDLIDGIELLVVPEEGVA